MSRKDSTIKQMPNIPGHKRNANPNNIKILPKWLSSKTQTTTIVGKDVWQIRTLTHSWWECKLVQSIWKRLKN
jgi:hypothetical protein